MGTSDVQTTLPCECGKSVVARAKDAGGAVACDCGRSVTVPALSKLRTLTGADAFVTNPAEAIRKLQAQGINPAGSQCLLCGSGSAVSYNCHAVCESSHVKRSGSDGSSNYGVSLLRLLFLPIVINILLSMRKKSFEPEVHGHDIELDFTLPVCDPCASMAGKVTRPAIARQLIASVPAFAELIAYYPQMKLTVERPAS